MSSLIFGLDFFSLRAIIEDTSQTTIFWSLYMNSFYNNFSCYEFRLKILGNQEVFLDFLRKILGNQEIKKNSKLVADTA